MRSILFALLLIFGLSTPASAAPTDILSAALAQASLTRYWTAFHPLLAAAEGRLIVNDRATALALAEPLGLSWLEAMRRVRRLPASEEERVALADLAMMSARLIQLEFAAGRPDRADVIRAEADRLIEFGLPDWNPRDRGARKYRGGSLAALQILETYLDNKQIARIHLWMANRQARMLAEIPDDRIDVIRWRFALTAAAADPTLLAMAGARFEALTDPTLRGHGFARLSLIAARLGRREEALRWLAASEAAGGFDQLSGVRDVDVLDRNDPLPNNSILFRYLAFKLLHPGREPRKLDDRAKDAFSHPGWPFMREATEALNAVRLGDERQALIRFKRAYVLILAKLEADARQQKNEDRILAEQCKRDRDEQACESHEGVYGNMKGLYDVNAPHYLRLILATEATRREQDGLAAALMAYQPDLPLDILAQFRQSQGSADLSLAYMRLACQRGMSRVPEQELVLDTSGWAGQNYRDVSTILSCRSLGADAIADTLPRQQSPADAQQASDMDPRFESLIYTGDDWRDRLADPPPWP